VSYGYGWGYAQPKIEPLAIVGIAVGVFGLVCCFIGAPAALALGLVARSRIRSSGGALTGEGWAITSIAVGALGIVWFVVSMVLQLSVFRLNFR
jgi:hypothetical protein